jgi:hypothetical protein
MRVITITLLALYFLSFAGCKDETTTSTSSNINNISIRTVNDTLAISIVANNHNYYDTIQIAFTVDTVNLYMAVNGYSGGVGLFKVFRDTNTVISKDLTSNYSISERIFTGIPTKAVLSLTNYKGNASILLSK